MGQFLITIKAIGANGCDRRSQPGEKLHHRCKRLDCPDCLAYDFVQQLRLKGMVPAEAEITHNPGRVGGEVTDDLLTNTRKNGSF